MRDFKEGDLVRVKDFEWVPNTPSFPDALFRVEYINDGKLALSVDGSNVCFILDAKHFELVETPEQH